MDDFFESIDVLLFPSQWKESFGLTVREALIRDVWVIATDGGGSVEDIVDGVNGTILPFTAAAGDLRAAVEAVLERPDRLAGHLNPHKGRVTTYEAQARELHAILKEVIGRSP
jgi:glycosyltransferase involved in cell wall biosynthesis